MRARRALPLLLLAGLLARVVYLSQVSSLPFFEDPVGDSARYLERARQIASGALVGDEPFFYGGIFYPYLLALDLLLVGRSLYPIALLQTCLGCVTGWLLYRLTREAARPSDGSGGESAGLVAAAMAVLYGPFAFFEADILMISWTLAGLAACGLLLLTATRTSGARTIAWRGGLAGLCLGLSISERPNLIALLPALLLWLYLWLPARWRAAGVGGFAAGAACVLAIVAALNAAASGRWVALTTSSGINFYIGNHPGARGTYDEPWAATDSEFTFSHPDLEEASLTMARRLSGRELDPVDASRFWLRKGREYLAGHPTEAARLCLRKLALFWNAQEVPNHLNFRFMREVAPALWLMPLGFGVVAPLALYGLVSPAARASLSRPGLGLLALMVLVPMITVLPFFVADRYRVTALPPLMVLAAFGAVSLWRTLRLRLTRHKGSLHLACVVLLGAAMARPLADFDVSRDSWLMAQAYRKRGDLTSASAWYERAVREAPNDAVLRNNRGVVLAQAGDLEGAEREYRTAIALEPDLILPRKNLGLILMRAGPAAAEEAYGHLALAESALPDDLEVARAMAALLVTRGDAVEARRRALKVLESDPNDPGALAVMAATGAAGEPQSRSGQGSR